MKPGIGRNTSSALGYCLTSIGLRAVCSLGSCGSLIFSWVQWKLYSQNSNVCSHIVHVNIAVLRAEVL